VLAEGPIVTLDDAITRIQQAGDRYTASERRVADFCVQTFPRVVFETVATLALATSTSPPTVMRFAHKAGFQGFSDLQRAAKDAIDGDWERALDRLRKSRRGPESSWTSRGLTADLTNLERTYEGVNAGDFDDVIALLADDRRALYLAGGEVTHGICLSFAAMLQWLRDDVHVLGTSAAHLSSELAQLRPGSVLFCFHLRRITHLSSQVIAAALDAKCDAIVVTNSPTLPLPELVRHVLVLHLQGAGGVIDSYTAAASIVNTLAAGVADARRDVLIERFNRLEETWRLLGIYIE
jgi:DNA-binding MurR/RpiR family transcriptional regulator